MSLRYTRRLGSSVLMSAALLCAAAPASAQDHQLAGLLLDLLSHAGRNAANNVQHPMHYIPGLALELAPRELNKAIASQLTTFPLPSSSGGFAFTTDPATGEVRLKAATFGPVFADRALTIGKGRFDFGLAFQPVKFDSFETAELTGSNIRFFLEHNNCCPAGNNAPNLPAGEGPSQFTPDFERDLLRSEISLEIETNTTVFYANYGVTDRSGRRRRDSRRPRKVRRQRHVHHRTHRDLRAAHHPQLRRARASLPDALRNGFGHRPGRHSPPREVQPRPEQCQCAGRFDRPAAADGRQGRSAGHRRDADEAVAARVRRVRPLRAARVFRLHVLERRRQRSHRGRTDHCPGRPE